MLGALPAASLHGCEHRCELLSEHHVSLDLELAAHESLHAVELALHHRDPVSIGHRDCAIDLRLFAVLRTPAAVLEVQDELALGATVAHNELENSAAHLHHLRTL